jgi:pyruvate formate lyase activating enzyme
MAKCTVCDTRSEMICRSLGLCAACILADTSEARAQAESAHARARERFGLPARPPRHAGGVRCRRCVNMCRIEAGGLGYCGVRASDGKRLAGGDPDAAVVQWYHDPLPTNCVADWVCPASGPAGYPAFTDTKGPECSHHNLAVFYEACSFDCLFCQNWHFRAHSLAGPRCSAAELATGVTPETRCICFFGGDPSCQVEHAFAAARLARKARPDGILRICWETNGSVSREALDEMAQLSLESGGCIKFDLKAWDEALHRALCGASNRRTLSNFEHLAGWIARRPDPPLLVASTLLVPGYIDADQVGRIAAFIARLDPSIPYALLAFHPSFEMDDLPRTSRRQAEECLAAAQAAGLTRVRVGNIHLLS